jgi:hypothetical protein
MGILSFNALQGSVDPDAEGPAFVRPSQAILRRAKALPSERENQPGDGCLLLKQWSNRR